MPLSNTSLIHPQWSQHHQPSVETAMRSTIDILAPLSELPPPNPFDPAPEPDEAPAEVVKDGVPARIRVLAEGDGLVPSGQANTTMSYLVQIPAHAFDAITVGDDGHRIRVTSNPNGPAIEGRVLTVDAARHESHAFNRDLAVSEHVTQEQEAS